MKGGFIVSVVAEVGTRWKRRKDAKVECVYNEPLTCKVCVMMIQIKQTDNAFDLNYEQTCSNLKLRKSTYAFNDYWIPWDLDTNYPYSPRKILSQTSITRGTSFVKSSAYSDGKRERDWNSGRFNKTWSKVDLGFVSFHIEVAVI